MLLSGEGLPLSPHSVFRLPDCPDGARLPPGLISSTADLRTQRKLLSLTLIPQSQPSLLFPDDTVDSLGCLDVTREDCGEGPTLTHLPGLWMPLPLMQLPGKETMVWRAAGRVNTEAAVGRGSPSSLWNKPGVIPFLHLLVLSQLYSFCFGATISAPLVPFPLHSASTLEEAGMSQQVSG